MCGIIGVIGREQAAPLLIDGLKRLEYRGYDSAGIATLTDGRIGRRRAEGKLVNLVERLKTEPLGGTIGIGHTRWATHGAPSVDNAHPIATHRVAVVHNGIIENFQDLKHELVASGVTFESETDTEVVAQLLTRFLDQGLEPEEAMRATLGRIEGAFALAVLFTGEEDLMICARRGSALAIGHGDGQMFVGSDALALSPLTQRVTYLEEGDWATLRADGVVIHDASGDEVSRPVKNSDVSGALIGKGNHRHFMHKEIHEQPSVAGETIHALLDRTHGRFMLPELPRDLAELDHFTIVACGTSLNAAMVARYWLERIARIRVDVEIASEFRYRAPLMREGGLALFISQSGETVDTLAALRYARAQGQHILALVNQAESSIARESDAVLQTLAGPEIGVASTKAFTTQLIVLACLTLAWARARGTLDERTAQRLTAALGEVPSRMAEILEEEPAIEQLAHEIAGARDVLYLGRGTSYPLALEGALKLKELSYIHAEGYPAGEMKHGPIALIDDSVPVIVLAPRDELFGKTAANIQEVAARGGRVVLLSDAAGIAETGGRARHAIRLPECDPFVAPILYALPVQLLAYHVALAKGTDVDQPRNLAKSVTVE